MYVYDSRMISIKFETYRVVLNLIQNVKNKDHFW